MSALLDATKAYLAVQANGWGHADALKTSRMIFSAGGFGGVGNGNFWPNSFRKLTDPWPERAGARGNTEGFEWNSTVRACLTWIQKTFPEPRICVMEGEGEDAREVPGHPLTQLLNRPNPYFTPHALWQKTLLDWWLPNRGNGNAYWQVVVSLGGEPLELWPLPAREIEPDWPKDGSKYLSVYKRTVNGLTVELDPRYVIHFRFGEDPQNNRKGWSPLLAGAAEMRTLNEGAEYREFLLANHGLPSYAYTPATPEEAQAMDEEKAKLLEKMWKSKYTGKNRGALFLTNLAGKLERVGYSPQELDIRELLEWDADMLCALFGLSSMLLGLPSGDKHRTFANMSEAREAAFESNIIPTQAMFAADLELQLLPLFPGYRPSLHVAWDYTNVRVLQEDQNKLWERILKAESQEVLTPDEARKKFGYQPFADGSGKLPRRRPSVASGENSERPGEPGAVAENEPASR